MVQFQNVTKVFPNGVVGIEDVSFTLDEGEFVFLIGPSGSGKTTLIEMLIRDQTPTSGKIFLDDVDITHITRRKVYKLRRQIGVIFQDFKLVPEKTAYENVSFAMEAAGKSNKEIRENVPYLLDIVGLSHRTNAFPKQLSGGEQQRVAIARAIANNPRILIADEPTGNLDPASAWDIVQILSKINNWGTTVIMSTHGTEIVNSLNKRVIQMEGGKVKRDDSKGQYEFDTTLEEKLEDHEEKTEAVGSDEEGSGNSRPEYPEYDGDESPAKPETTPDRKKQLKINITDKVKTNKPEDDFENQVEGGIVAKIFGIFGNKQHAEEIREEKAEEKHEDEVLDEKSDESMKEVLQESESDIKPPKAKLAGLGNKLDNRSFNLDDSKTKVKKAIEKSSAKPVSHLNLPKMVLQDLKKAGYNKIGEIIDDGLHNLSEKLKLNKEETVMVAEAVEKYIETQGKK